MSIQQSTVRSRTMSRFLLCLSTIGFCLLGGTAAEAKGPCYRVVVTPTYQPVVYYAPAYQEWGACCFFDIQTGRRVCRQDTQHGCETCWGSGTECTWYRGQSCQQACRNYPRPALQAMSYGACCHYDTYSGQYFCRQDTEGGCSICWGPGTECTWSAGKSCSQACGVR